MKTPNKYSGKKLKKPNMKQEGNFTQIPNAFILNPEIRDPELRLLQYIMTYSENRTITTKNCIFYLGKTKPAICASFEKLIALGVLKITDENIEVIIPEEMKKYTLGYLQGKENNTIEVKKTLPTESEKPLQEGKENNTIEVKKTLPTESEKPLQEGKENNTIEVKKTLLPGKENLTIEVKKTYKKPLESIDIENVINPVILSNTRVLPVPATSGSTGQPHSNHNTKGKTGIELDLGSVPLTSLASPSVLAQTLHTPNIEVDKVDPAKVVLDDTLPIVEKSELPIVPDVRFSEQLKLYTTSKYFLKDNLSRVLEIYQYYGDTYPKAFMSIETFEEVLVYLIITQMSDVMKYMNLNKCLRTYRNDIETRLEYVPQLYKEMQDNPTDVQNLLKEYELELNNTNENLHSDKTPIKVPKVDLHPIDDDCKDITSLTPTKSTNANPMTEGQDKNGLEDVPEPGMANEEINDDFPELPF